MNYGKLSKKKLIAMLEALQITQDSAHDADGEKSLLQELQVHRIELEMQNRELRKTQQELELSRDRYTDLYDYAPVGYLTLDTKGCIQEINLTGASMLGKERLHLCKTPFSNFIARDDRQTFRNHLLQCRTDGEKGVVELTLKVRDGSTMQVQMVSQAAMDHEQRFSHFRTLMTDVSEIKQMREELDRAKRMEAAGRVAGQIAHDFNNLLSPLVAYPLLIKEELSGRFDASMLDEMQECANKIAEINQQLLALGRRGHYLMEPVDLGCLVQKVILEQNLPSSLTLKTEFSPDLFLIKAGVAQLTRALINLINNADEAMSGSGTIIVKTENIYLDTPLKKYQVVEQGEYVRLSISDTGPGIPEKIIDRIFDPFFSTKKMDRLRGTGLGLSVVHGIIEDHKGYIIVDSRPGLGTTFSLYFPITRVEMQLIDDEVSLNGGNESILIVDDDPVQRRVLSKILTHIGYEVRIVASGELAVEWIQTTYFDLVLVDMVMDGIDGTETYRQILQVRPDQKAVVLSGFAMSERVKTALDLGARTFVMKPVMPSKLAAVVRSTLDEKKSRHNTVE